MLRRYLGRGNGVVDYVLLAVLVVLVIVFFQRRGTSLPAPSAKLNLASHMASRNLQGKNIVDLRQEGRVKAEDVYNKLVDERIKRVPDTRPKGCRLHTKHSDKVSIIIDFFDYSFYDLKITVGSVLHNTPAELIGEIILVDDGSTLDYITDDARAYIDKIPKARLLRLDSKQTSGHARMVGVQDAKFDTLVFLTTNVICNVGWLEPLLGQLTAKPYSFAIPHMDTINDPITYDYLKTDDNTVSAFSWSLSIESQLLEATNKTGPLATPVMRGDAFAVHKKAFLQIGGYDEVLVEAVSQALELSLRAWRCGMKLHVVQCSRVGVLTLNFPFRIVHAEEVHRLAHVWLHERLSLVYLSTKTSQDVTDDVKKEIQIRKSQLSSLKCHDLVWYIHKVAPMTYTPPMNVAAYGFLRVLSGNCARVGHQSRLDLGSCTPPKGYTKLDLMFEYVDMLLMHLDKCLSTSDTRYVIVDKCNDNDTRQQWKYRNGQLHNVLTGLCAIHVTDPDSSIKKGRQIIMAQNCEDDKEGKFSHWEFIVP